jgi:thiamine biosynthesis lipoprotein
MPIDLSRGHVETRVFMDTTVVVELVAPGRTAQELMHLADSAFGWFAEVERRCSRFDEQSELTKLSRRTAEAVSVSTLLFGALKLAVEVARLSGGAFDPTLGRAMEDAGFDKNYLTGARVTTPAARGIRATYDDVFLDDSTETVTLRRPMMLDLGAVAKGLAIDLAGQELRGLDGFAINAGGDILACGLNADMEPWRIGIRHPRQPDALLTTLRVSDAAVCTSGDYERPRSTGCGHHLLDAQSGGSSTAAVSATVVASSAAVADALSTAAFVLGPDAGRDVLTGEGVDGMIVGPDLHVVATAGMERYQS